MYLVSCLIPIFNTEKFIERCASSLFEQTYPKLEFIFVNDCTPDRSIEILQNVITQYPERKDSVRIINHEKNRGLAAARNTALEYSTGDFVCHVDSDDWIDPQMIDSLVKKQIETSADIVSCDAVVHDISGEYIWEEPEYLSKDDMMKRILQLTLDHVIWRRLIRRSLYTNNNIYAVEGFNIGEDHYTLPRLLYYADSYAKCSHGLYHYNCLSGQSYMRSTQEAFNSTRFKSNIAAINILMSFFSKKSSEYWGLLNQIKADYVYKYFFLVLKNNNRDAYNELCGDWRTIDNNYKNLTKVVHPRFLSPRFYSLNRMRVIGRIIIKKVFGIKHYDL